MKRENQPVVELRNVSKRFPIYRSTIRQVLGSFGIGSRAAHHKLAIDAIDLKIGRGERVGIVGRNGSGKTTLLRLINGFTRPSAGEIRVDGSIQALMQFGYGFNDELSGIENIRNALLYNELPISAMAEAEADIVDFVELGEFIQHPVKTYSLGMRARLEFAAATAIRPDVLVIDEVLGAGDGYFVHKCASRMRQLVADTTLLLVSHSLDQIREYCDRAIWIDDGCLRADGLVDKVLGDYRQFMSEQSSRLKSSLAAQANVSASQHEALMEKVISIFGPESTGAIIRNFSFDGASCLSLETGDPLALRLSVALEKPMFPLVLGMTEDGGFVFELEIDEALPPGRHEVVLRTQRSEIGVGNYVLIPTLRNAEEPSGMIIGRQLLELQVAVTNWSDPPLVHLDGEWRSGPSLTRLASKVNAWV